MSIKKFNSFKILLYLYFKFHSSCIDNNLYLIKKIKKNELLKNDLSY